MWTGGPHGVAKATSATDCNNLTVVAEPAATGSFPITFNTTGTWWYACPVDGHCGLGMMITINVT